MVWLTADESVLFERASRRNNRPLLQKPNPRATFSELFRTREPLYAAAADLRIDTSAMSNDEVAQTILSKLEEVSALRQ